MSEQILSISEAKKNFHDFLSNLKHNLDTPLLLVTASLL